MFLDLDGLSFIGSNDTHGHPVGAFTIAEVGRLIGKVIEGARRSTPAASAAMSSPRLHRPASDKDAPAGKIAEEIRAPVAAHRASSARAWW